MAHVADLAQYIDHPANLLAIADILPNCIKEDALEIEVLEQNKSKMDFNITRWRYAEIYEEMGLRDIGQLLSCRREADFCTRYNPDIDFEWNKTIRKVAPHCDFWLKMKTGPR